MAGTRQELGHNIRRARTQAGLTQGDLACAIEAKSSETVSAIERGDREVKAWELSAIARRVQVDMLDLLSAAGPSSGPAPLWRKAAVESRLDTECRLRLRAQRYRLVLELTESCPEEELPSWRSLDLGRMSVPVARQRAQEIWKAWGLGDRPALALAGNLEDRFCVMIFTQDLGDDGSAVCVRGEHGPAVLLNKREPPWRRAYSLAHELFHLLTWDAAGTEASRTDDALRAHVEKLAEAFASELLLPGQPLQAELRRHVQGGQLGVEGIVAVARQFGVSTSALLWRMANAGWIRRSEPGELLADPAFVHADKRTMSGLWDLPSDLPVRFVTLALVAHKRGRLSKARLAEMLEADLVSLDAKLSEYGLGLNIDAAYETEGIPA